MVSLTTESGSAADKSDAKSTVVLECNYEDNCPPLYEAIEAATTEADFDRILTFLDTGRWEGTFFSTSSDDPVTQAKTWTTRFDAEDETKVKWSQLPLHLSIVCSAPIAIIKALVKLYPQALRCTDDQHMLPLHLALRHGASDEIVSFLLLEFPEAVNAKGKNGRTSVECAQRAKDKHRGVILEVFVERTKSRLSSSVITERSALKAVIESKAQDITTIQSELAAKESVVEKLRSDLAKTKAELEKTTSDKSAVETDLLRKVQELENANAELDTEAKEQTEKLRAAKLVETLELQKKVDELEANKKEMEEMQRKAREDEASLRKELEIVQKKVADSLSSADWNKLKSEVEALQAERLKLGLDQAKHEIETLKDELNKTLEEAKAAESKNIKLKSDLKSELRSIKKTVDLLQADDGTVKSSDDLRVLRDEVKSLRAEMKSRSEASKTKIELAVLKKAMEMELRNAEGKTNEELEALKKAVKLANEKNLDNKTAAELAAVKADLQHLKKVLTEKELESTTKKDMEELRESLAHAAMNPADPKTKSELTALKTKADALYVQVMDTKSNEGMIVLKKEVESLKDVLKKFPPKSMRKQLVSSRLLKRS
jgi:hypothetical protein